MTQRIFDIENEKDMQDLWSILPDDATIIRNLHEDYGEYRIEGIIGESHIDSDLIAINWHDKKEITRPIQEATEDDIGKICAFWEDCYSRPVYSELHSIKPKTTYKYIAVMDSNGYEHCRRLTKQEIEELC